jgi:hypothetical protein
MSAVALSTVSSDGIDPAAIIQPLAREALRILSKLSNPRVGE